MGFDQHLAALLCDQAETLQRRGPLANIRLQKPLHHIWKLKSHHLLLLPQNRRQGMEQPKAVLLMLCLLTSMESNIFTNALFDAIIMRYVIQRLAVNRFDDNSKV